MDGHPTHDAGPLDPWLSMWTRPRATVRRLVQTRPEHAVLLLAALGGVAQVLDRASWRNLGDHYGPGAIFLAAVVAGPIGGVITLYLFGWLISVTGRWLGGEAPPSHVRTAMAWGNLPNVAGLLLWLPALALIGQEMFTSLTPQLDAQPVLALLLLPLGLAWMALAIWSLVLLLHGLGEVQGFSAWRALGNVLLAVVLVLAPLFVLGVLAVMFAPALAA